MEYYSIPSKYLRRGSTDKTRRIFLRFFEEIPKIGDIELKPFDSYPSFYAGCRLVGVQLLKDQVKMHLTIEDAEYAYSLEKLRSSILPHEGREEWAFIYIINNKRTTDRTSVKGYKESILQESSFWFF